MCRVVATSLCRLVSAIPLLLHRRDVSDVADELCPEFMAANGRCNRRRRRSRAGRDDSISIGGGKVQKTPHKTTPINTATIPSVDVLQDQFKVTVSASIMWPKMQFREHRESKSIIDCIVNIVHALVVSDEVDGPPPARVQLGQKVGSILTLTASLVLLVIDFRVAGSRGRSELLHCLPV